MSHFFFIGLVIFCKEETFVLTFGAFEAERWLECWRSGLSGSVRLGLVTSAQGALARKDI